MRHFLLAGAILALTGCGALKPEARPEPEVAFTCRGRPPPPRSSVTHSNALVGRLELKRLSPEPEPVAATAAPEGTPAAPAASDSAGRLPETRFRLIAEAAPLGALGAAMASELGMSVVVAAPLVDLRVSLALPDTDTARLLGLLRAHYGVGSTYTQGVLSLEEREELLERLLLVEPAPLMTQLIPVEGLPAEQIASAWCEQAASSRGMASVVGKHLLVKDSEERIRILGRMIGALQGTHSLMDAPPDDGRPEESPGVDLEP